MALDALEHVGDRREQLLVGVEVEHARVTAIEQVEEQQRLERAADGHDVVVHERAEAAGGERGEGEAAGRRLADQRADQRDAGVVAGQALARARARRSRGSR